MSNHQELGGAILANIDVRPISNAPPIREMPSYVLNE